MIKNVICVDAGVPTTYMGVYQIEVIGNEWRNVTFKNWIEVTGLKSNIVADLIMDLSGEEICSAVIIDCHAFGLAINDELESKGFATTIIKAMPNTISCYEGMVNLINHKKNDNLIISKHINLQLGLFVDTLFTGSSIESQNKIANLAQLFTFINTNILDDKN